MKTVVAVMEFTAQGCNYPVNRCPDPPNPHDEFVFGVEEPGR